MKELKFLFNKDTSRYFENDKELDLMYLKTMQSWFEAHIRAFGYIYPNLIYEQLGLEWNPKHDNKCFINNEESFIEFETLDVDEGFEITIKYQPKTES